MKKCLIIMKALLSFREWQPFLQEQRGEQQDQEEQEQKMAQVQSTRSRRRSVGG